MKRKLLVLLAILAVTCCAGVASADTTTLDFNVNLNGFNTPQGTTLATLTITVPDGGGVATFDLLPTSSVVVGGVTYHFALMPGPLALNVTGAFDLTPTGFVTTPLDGLTPGAITLVQPTAANANFDGAGHMNTFLSSDGGQGFNNAFAELTFTSTQSFADVAAVLAALTANSPQGFFAAVDLAEYQTIAGGTIATGWAAVPIPPSALLLGSGLLGLVGFGWRRRKS